MPSKYKLVYFNVTGRAEMIRTMFAAAGVEYEDERIKMADWPNFKADMPQHQLPVLEVDGKTRIVQSLTIARFVARELKFYGQTHLEAAFIDVILDTLVDMGDKAIPYLLEKDATKKAELKKAFQEEVPKYLGFLEKAIESHGKDGFAVSSSLSLADFVIYGVLDFFQLSHLFDKFPKVGASFKHVETNEKVAKYIKGRPENEFNPAV